MRQHSPVTNQYSVYNCIRMKSVKQLNKRAFSPIVPKNDSSDRKKKSNSNYPNNPYQASREFDSYANRDKKRPSNYLKDMLKQSDPVNKYRIVTEPVDDRIMTIVSSSFLPSRSKGKLDQELNSKSRHLSNEKRSHNQQPLCPNCRSYIDELSSLKNELSHIISSKVTWKSGQLPLASVKEEFGLGKCKGKAVLKSTEGVLFQARRHFYDLMRDIETLSEIDYPKMLSLKIFKYEPHLQAPKPKEEEEVKSLLAQLRNHYEGKLHAWDLEDEGQESDHVKAIVRNLKTRLSHYLRENLELRMKKAVLEKAEEISLESEDYLRHIVEEVLLSYAKKI